MIFLGIFTKFLTKLLVKEPDYCFPGSEDLIQCEAKPSALSARGHQGPAAFLMMGSLLDKVLNLSLY